MTGILLGPLDGLMIGTGEAYLVGLSLGITFVSPLDLPNLESELPGTLIGCPLGLCFGSDVVLGVGVRAT